MSESLQEDLVIYRDDVFRRQPKFIMLASVESVVPKNTTLDPSIYGYGNGEYTWGRLERFFSRYPGSRHHQQPMHWYTEYLKRDYVTYVGCPSTNRSWWLQEMVQLGALPPAYLDSPLIVLQENFAVEAVDKQLWRHLAHNVVSPLLRELQFPRERVVFFEKVANREVVYSDSYPYLFEEPANLDEVMFDMYLKEYGKR